MSSAALSQPLESRNNELSLVDRDGVTQVVKRYRHKKRTLRTFTYSALRRLGQQVPVEYQSLGERRDFEKECIQLWQDRGFSVPQVLKADVQDPDTHRSPSTPTLHLEYIPARSLHDYVRDASVPEAGKLEVLREVFAEIRRRHCYALFEQNHLLIHYDSNMRNILLGPEGPVTIDFESGHLNEKISRSAAREVKKLAIELSNALTEDPLETVVQLLWDHYGIRHILRKMCDEEFQRPFLKHHLRRDRKRKSKHPQLLTKLDIAVALRKRFESPTAAIKDANLNAAVNTSWDGKFYQSLSDHDLRGRDMPHRYAVMQFPEDMSGKTLLDIGCNVGRVCLDAERRGATRTVGIDDRKDVMNVMNTYCRDRQLQSRFYAFDVNQGAEKLQELIGPRRFDYVCALSIWSHVDQQALWDIINATAADTCYFEDNSPSRVKSLDRIAATLVEKLHFSKIDFLGFTTDRGVRAVFRLQGKK